MAKKLKCEYCEAKMMVDEDEYRCPDCGAIAFEDGCGGYYWFEDEDQAYQNVGNVRICDKCGSEMVHLDEDDYRIVDGEEIYSGWECPECGYFTCSDPDWDDDDYEV